MPHFGELTDQALQALGYRTIAQLIALGYRTEAELIAAGFVRMATGTYTGDGNATQSITGVGFRPKYLYIATQPVAEVGYDTFEAVDVITATYCYWNGVSARFDRIISLDDDGFTVGDKLADLPPNKLGEVYIFMALG